MSWARSLRAVTDRCQSNSVRGRFTLIGQRWASRRAGRRSSAGRSLVVAAPRPLLEPGRPVAPHHRAGADAFGDLGPQPGRLVDQGVGVPSDPAGILSELNTLVVVPAPDHAAILGY
jgi:hypothetical protein